MIKEHLQNEVNSLTKSLSKHFGTNFIAGYHSPINIRVENYESLKQILPYFNEAKQLLKKGDSLKYVEWVSEKGINDWVYLTSSTEARPDKKGKYKCDKGYKYDDKDQTWFQVFTHIDTNNEPLLIHDEAKDAVKSSLNTAIINKFGVDFFNKYLQSQIIDPLKLPQLPLGEKLLKYIPKKKMQVRYLESTEQRDHIVIRENAVFLQSYGLNFMLAYNSAPDLDIDKLIENPDQKPPLFDQLKKYVLDDGDFEGSRYVEWVNKEGKASFAYVVHWFNENKKSHQFQIIKPFNNQMGETDLLSEYYSFNSNQEGNDISFLRKQQQYYILEQENGNNRIVRIIKPNNSFKSGFEIEFIGVVDKKTNKCLVYNEIFDHVSFHLKKLGLIKSNADINSFTRNLNYQFGGQIVKKAKDINANLSGEKAVYKHNKEKRRSRKLWLATYVLNLIEFEFLKLNFVQSLENPQIYFNFNIDIYTLGISSFFALMASHNLTKSIENYAEDLGYLKLFIQSVRENGVDLFDGVPDDQLFILQKKLLNYL